MSARNLDGRVIVVTGAANGIGEATAGLLAERGAKLFLTDIDAGRLESVRAALGSQATARAGDIADGAAVEQLAHAAAQHYGRVDAVVNIAGIVHPGLVDQSPVQHIRRQIDINLGGTINVARAFLPSFRRQGAGHLVFIASLAGMVPLPGESIYAATKFAVRGFALSLALELRGTGIDVTVVCPDSTRTRMLDHEARERGSSLSFTNPPMAADTVARAIVRALERPKLEVTVPGARGRLIALLGAVPALFPLLYPMLDAQGKRNHARYLAALDGAR